MLDRLGSARLSTLVGLLCIFQTLEQIESRHLFDWVSAKRQFRPMPLASRSRRRMAAAITLFSLTKITTGQSGRRYETECRVPMLCSERQAVESPTSHASLPCPPSALHCVRPPLRITWFPGPLYTPKMQERTALATLVDWSAGQEATDGIEPEAK